MFKKYMQKLKKDQRGLTLVELLAVVVILAIVAAIAFVVIGNVIDNSRQDAHIANAQQVISAAKVYESTGGQIGTSGVSVATLKEKELLGTLQDPWKGTAAYPASDTAAKVTKSGGVYSIEGFSGSGCTLGTETETDLNKDGRDLCE